MSGTHDQSPAARLAAAGDDAERAFERRNEPTRALASQADAITGACHAMAVRYQRAASS